MARGSERPSSRGATLFELMVCIGLVALAAMGAFALFGGVVREQTVAFGAKVLHLEANAPGPTPSARPDSKSFVTATGGPTCDAIRGCSGGPVAMAVVTPTAPVSHVRIDGIIRRLLLLPDDQRGAALAALPASDFAAVDARLGALRGAFQQLRDAHDPAFEAMAAASVRYRTSQEGFFPSFFNAGEIAAATTARDQALAGLFTRAATLADTATPATPDSSSGLFDEMWKLSMRTMVAPDFGHSNDGGTWPLAGLSVATPAERARTWEIQRARDAETANAVAFAEFLATQPYAVRREAAAAERDFLSTIRAGLPAAARAEFSRLFRAETVVVNGVPEVRLVPTRALRELQDAQAALLGVEVDGLTTRRTIPFNAPSNGVEALRWWLTYGQLDPRALASKWNPQNDAIETADGVFALLPIGTGIAVVRGLGTLAAREILGAAAREVVLNAAVLGTSEAIAERYGPLAGTGFAVATVLASLVTHRIVSSPRLVAAAETFGGCFVAGTRVVTENGELPIEQIRVGMRVLSRDVETEELRFAPVVQTFVKHDKAIVRLALEGESLGVTLEHPFWVDGRGWTKAEDLSPGDVLATATGATLVRSLSLERETQDVYNFEVEDTHTYFVGAHAAWVHNICEGLVRRLVAPGTGSQKLTFQRENFPDVAPRIHGDVTPSVVNPAAAANEAATAVLLAREPNIAAVYLGDDAVRFLQARAIARGTPFPKNSRFPDVVAVTTEGDIVIAEAKGKSVSSAGGQFESVGQYVGRDRLTQRIYSSAPPGVGGELGPGYMIGPDGFVRRILNEGEVVQGAEQVWFARTGEMVWTVPWTPNGVPVRVYVPAEISTGLTGH